MIGITMISAVGRIKAHIMVEIALDYLDLEYTERCNLSCSHCYIRRSGNDLEAASKEMDFALISRLLKQAVSLNCSNLRITGGEPLLRQDFERVFNQAIGLGMHVSVATNATLITDRIADLISSSRKVDVSTSLYGWDEPSFDETVGIPGAFTNFLVGLSRLRARKVQFRLRYPPTRKLVGNLHRLRPLPFTLGAVEPLQYSWELILHSRQDSSANRAIKGMRLSPLEAARERLREPQVALEEMKKLIKWSGRPFDGRLFHCPRTVRRMTVDAYGNLQLCLELRHPDLRVNLRDHSLRDAVAILMSRAREIRATDGDFLTRCARCLLRPACPQCPVCSWLEFGTLDTPVDYYCNVMHEEARLLGLIEEGERGWRARSLRF